MITHLFPPAALGGYERILSGIVESLRTGGHETVVLTTAPVPGAELPEWYEDPPWVHRELGWWWADHAFRKPSLRERRQVPLTNARILDEHLAAGVDVVVWGGMGGMTLDLIDHVHAANVPAVAYVADLWQTYAPRHDVSLPPRRGRAARWAETAEWIYISQFTRDASLVPGRVLPAGVDRELFAHSPAGEWRWRLAYVGRVEERKGVHVAAQALQHLPAAATLTIRGQAEPAYLARLEPYAPLLRYTDDEVAAVYGGADAVVFPVVWEEPWGLVPLEAMSVGRPVVATATGGAREYLRHEENALIVEPGDSEGLAAAVVRLAEDADLRARLVAGGRETAARHDRRSFERAFIEALEQAVRAGTR